MVGLAAIRGSRAKIDIEQIYTLLSHPRKKKRPISNSKPGNKAANSLYIHVHVLTYTCMLEYPYIFSIYTYMYIPVAMS